MVGEEGGGGTAGGGEIKLGEKEESWGREIWEDGQLGEGDMGRRTVGERETKEGGELVKTEMRCVGEGERKGGKARKREGNGEGSWLVDSLGGCSAACGWRV